MLKPPMPLLLPPRRSQCLPEGQAGGGVRRSAGGRQRHAQRCGGLCMGGTCSPVQAHRGCWAQPLWQQLHLTALLRRRARREGTACTSNLCVPFHGLAAGASRLSLDFSSLLGPLFSMWLLQVRPLGVLCTLCTLCMLCMLPCCGVVWNVRLLCLGCMSSATHHSPTCTSHPVPPGLPAQLASLNACAILQLMFQLILPVGVHTLVAARICSSYLRLYLRLFHPSLCSSSCLWACTRWSARRSSTCGS